MLLCGYLQHYPNKLCFILSGISLSKENIQEQVIRLEVVQDDRSGIEGGQNMSHHSIVGIRHLIHQHRLETHRSYLQYLANHEQYSYQKFVLRVQTRDRFQIDK